MTSPEARYDVPAPWEENPGSPLLRGVSYLLVLGAAAAVFLLVRGRPWTLGDQSHALLEVVSTLTALFIGVLALVRFYSRKNNVFLFLGTGFLGTAFLDGFHAWASLGAPGSAAQGAWGWTASRTLLALFFCLNWLGWRRERRLGQAGRVGERMVYVTTAVLTLVTVGILVAAPLPPVVQAVGAFPRPQALAPAALFLFALLGYLAKGHWKDNAFDHWLVVSLVVGLAAQVPFMAYAATPYGPLDAAAHGLKIASYLCMLTGLMISVYSTFRQAEESAAALAREVVERERAQAELEIQKAYLEKLFESAPEAIIVLDEKDRVTRMNDEFTRTFGWKRKEVLGRGIADLIVPEERRAEARGWNERVARGQTVGYETVRRRRDESRVEVSVLSTAIDLEPGRTAIYQIYRDITARKRAEEELRQAKEAAEEATRAKSEFLAHMSHELRTPLNSVIGFAAVLLKSARGSLGSKEVTYLERIRENGLHLLGLINDILDLSKIEAGKMTVETTPVDVRRLVEETMDQFRGQVLDREVRLETRIPEDLHPIRTDPGKLKQVLLNLIGNAVKFTEKGRVVVRVVADPVTGRPARIEVEDTGIGIPPERLRKIFEAFEQAETGTSRTYGGTGLGLTISSSLCALLGYELDVRSEVGKGSVFGVALSGDGAAGPDLATREGEKRPAPDGRTERSV